MKKNKQIVLFLLYAVVFLAVIGLQTYAMKGMDMRQHVNIYTIIIAVAGGLLFYLLMRGEKNVLEITAEKVQKTSETDKLAETSRAQTSESPTKPVPKEVYIEATKNYSLTTREREIGFLILSGYSNARIAEELFISEATVKKHVSHIYEKTGVQSRKEFKGLFAEW